MRKFTRFLGLVLAALVLMPVSVKAQQIYPQLSFLDATGAPIRQVEATLDEEFTPPTLTCDYREVLRSVRYSSSNERVAFVDSVSGYVVLYSAGNATITAYFAGDSVYAAARAMYNLIVKEAEVPATQDSLVCPEARYNLPDNVLSLKVGETASIPELLGETGAIYQLTRKSIIDTQVATLTEDEMIYALSEGTTQFIGVTFQIGADNQTKMCEYPFDIVVEPADTTATEEPECPIAYFFLNGELIKSVTLKVGESMRVPNLMGETGAVYELTEMMITEETQRIAQVSADGLIYGLSEGTAEFIGYVLQTFNGDLFPCEYYLSVIVEAGADTTQLADPELSFDEAEVFLELGDSLIVPNLINPHNINFTPNNSKWYTNWDSKVAQVDEATGVVTLLGATGDETIYFEFIGNDEYKGGIASYVIHVSTSGLIVGGVLVTNSNAEDILPGFGYIWYDQESHTLTMAEAAISEQNIVIEGAPARAKAAQEIQAGIYYSDPNPLTIVLIGANAINYGDAGIFTESAPVVMMGTEEVAGSIRISAQTVGVKAAAFKIYKCYVTASGGSAGVAVNELGVATGANLVAQGQGLAIQANSLIMAEDHDGEGIAILTEGVTFEKGKGFFKDGKVATFVEIGKVAIPVPDDEVTTIDFTQTDPTGNESVLFSADANNTFNEETQQLEITTSISDEVVASALENLVPGSSAWVDALPGSITFDIPAGKGEILVQCLTLPGYELKVKMAGKEAVSITQASFGWAKVSYDVPAAVHVVIYLHATSPASAPARIAASLKDGDPTVGACIKALQIVPANAPQAIDLIEAENGQTSKILFRGQLYILRDGRIFTAQGAEIK